MSGRGRSQRDRGGGRGRGGREGGRGRGGRGRGGRGRGGGGFVVVGNMVVVGDIPADARPVNTNNRGGNGEPVSPWKNSRAKAQLAEMLKDRTSNVRTISVDAVWESNPLFRQYPWPRFKQNFKSLKKKIDDEAAAIAFDQRSYEHEQEKFPRNATTMRGQPFWNGHPAESLMEADVKQGIISGMKPKAVRQSRPEYQEFDLPCGIISTKKKRNKLKNHTGK